VRILAVTNLYPNPRQPHRAPFNRRQFAALALEHEVRVIAPIAWTSRLNSAVDARSSTPRRRVSDGMTIEHPEFLFTPRVLRGLYGHFYARSIRACFHRSVREFAPDIVLASWAYPDGWAAVQLAREAALPVAIKVHGSDLLSPHPGSARFQRTVEALQRADAVIAVGRHLRDHALSMGADPARVHIVRSGLDTDLFRPGPSAEARSRLKIITSDPVLFFAGNLVPVKGLDVLIEALGELAATGSSFQCTCAGSGPLRAALQRQAESRGLGSRVHFIGALPQEQLADWYRAADLVILPSRSEGVPNVLLEAAACGRPMIASRVGGVPEICNPAGLVPPGDPTALAQRIREFLNPVTRPSTTPRFTPGSWRESAQALASVLQDLVGRASKLKLGEAA